MNTPQQPNPNKKRRRFRNRNRGGGGGGQPNREGQPNQGQPQNRAPQGGPQNRGQGQAPQARGPHPQGQKGKQPQKAPQRQKQPQQPNPPDVIYKPGPPKRYGVVFYDSLFAAKADMDTLRHKATEVDQLNIVIRAESDMEDPELTKIGKVFAGAAWTLIHERRVEEGWYNDPH